MRTLIRFSRCLRILSAVLWLATAARCPALFVPQPGPPPRPGTGGQVTETAPVVPGQPPPVFVVVGSGAGFEGIPVGNPAGPVVQVGNQWQQKWNIPEGIPDVRNGTAVPGGGGGGLGGGGGGGGGGAGALYINGGPFYTNGLYADLSIEALYQANGSVTIGDLFGQLALDGLVVGTTGLQIPDVFSTQVTPDANGVCSLYSLVDINEYPLTAPTWWVGENIDIINGTSPLLPGMMFSTTPFTFTGTTSAAYPGDPFAGSGFSGTPATVDDVILSVHYVYANEVPEPSALALAGISLALVACALRR